MIKRVWVIDCNDLCQVPAVAFSAGNGTHRSFTTNTGEKDDPANLAGSVRV